MNLWKVLLVSATLAWIQPGLADSWMPARQFESSSENSNFVAVVRPSSGTNKATVSVLDSKSNRKQVWTAELSNRVSPTGVMLTDDGRYVVTLDNWGGVGYGDDVVAFYDSRGQLSKYSLEQFAPLNPETNSFLRKNVQKVKDLIMPSPKALTTSFSSGYHGRFSHSTASRRWRTDSISFFWPRVNATLFCLWLDWDDRWVAWHLKSGKLFEPSSSQTSEWNAEGRRRSRKLSQSGAASGADYNFLGRLRIKEDRPIIESWLADPNFSTGSRQSSTSSGSEKQEIRYVLTAYSYKRGKADQILARWDGLTNANPTSLHDERYAFLGNVEGSVQLLMPPAKTNGFLGIQLSPTNQTTLAGGAIGADQCLKADLQWQRPYSFENGSSIEKGLGTNIEFAIYGVTPGFYRLRALWDKQAPFSVTNRSWTPSPGDYISTNASLIHVRKGEVTLAPNIECKTLVR